MSNAKNQPSSPTHTAAFPRTPETHQKAKMASNIQRAKWAGDAVGFHASETHSLMEDLETQVCDLLTNLRHFCRINELSFNELNRRALKLEIEECQVEDQTDNKQVGSDI